MGLSRIESSFWCGCRGHRWEPLDVEAAEELSTSVAVMAPALTEGGPQKPENLLPTLPVGFLSPKQASDICNNREVLAKFVVSANVKPSKIDDQFLLGISKDLIRDVINSKYAHNLDQLSGFGNNESNLIIEDNNFELEDERPIVPDIVPLTTDIIMNDPSMGDQTDNMCFLKSNVDVPLTDSAVDCDNKTLDDVDDIMGFTDKIQVDSNVGGVNDIGQNVEEILQVIKSMEGAANVVNSEISSSSQQNVNDGVVEMFPGSEIFPSFEQNLLDEDFVGLCADYANPQEDIEQVKVENLKPHEDLVVQNQYENERRCAFLMRRLRKLQARLVGRHVAEENTSVLQLAHNGVKQYFFQELSGISSKTAAKSSPEVNSSLSNFLENIEKTCVAQSSSVSRQRVMCRYFGAGSRDNSSTGSGSTSRHPAFAASQINIKGEEVENVAGPLASHLHLVESKLDSDCTASSSGGESCDEMQTFNNLHQQQLPISKRAAWRFAQDRASIASRWTWLQAQISDLEYRIRQHNDLQRHIRATKGLVILDNAETVNGYSGVLPGSTGRYNNNPADGGNNGTGGESSASRTRPFVWTIYKKRKLLQVDRLHEVSKRAAKASTIRCGCDHVLPSCALCTGRLDPTQPQEPLEQLSVQERVALVDPGFHPVLSFPDDTLQGTHLEAIMKSVDWQQKMLRGNVRMSKIKDKDASEKRSKKIAEHRTKYTSRLKKSTSSIVTSRIKRKVLKGKRSRLNRERNVHGLKKRVPKLSHVEDDEEMSALSSSSKHSSPVPSPLQHTAASSEKNSAIKEKTSTSHGRLRQNSYDIDNIVIPYSVAASTRLEKLQYKEILTPKWRLCDEPVKIDVKNGVMHRPSQDSDCEDVSDEAVVLRHGRSEKEEYKRFMTFANPPYQSRIRHNRRTDSRADSGANTPDPMSPHASDFGGDTTSPITSPPATPSNSHDAEHVDANRPPPLQHVLRRRTLSSLRFTREDREKDKEKETITSIVDEEREKEVPPYEPRMFPLPEDVYDKMLEVMPEGHWQASSASVCSREEDKIDNEEMDLDSPESDSTESAYCEVEGEDPNDPEWTVADDRNTEKERIRPTAKR
ncbi:KAT8 regulatory NSL complex subunit 1 [Leptopilina heterotoma]|uniref:KAT8 regulatory NSL complex subunit 1 n=1 Tax=Leptopilina heterotoma TaxID=63436 RepID=UPI001CA95286|nr:KAT8 regulatory NSL complex subunit 1 [Leptopilina heterotoma]XP_043466749.1 KAT8 regulatory NSL complex subunit 1 [Leptopilina heterotoma]XP_043466757.1 KAT8 regulatory NSL complex subunit 1 [Leptopilina heterotoma]XP_043466766.1 KAT8 regulatory NSL complex subunit 1 [Leptopilina heterotoma]XP_043466776.1 KAT8 regulatory NSL complex subunit 1 [Leptopilina heterotoma]